MRQPPLDLCLLVQNLIPHFSCEGRRGQHFLKVGQAFVKRCLDALSVHILADEDQLLHAVTVFRIPHLADLRIFLEYTVDGCLISGRKETTALHFLNEMACLLKDIAHFGLFGVPDHTLAADDSSRPLFSQGDQLLTVERAAAEIYE